MLGNHAYVFFQRNSVGGRSSFLAFSMSSLTSFRIFKTASAASIANTFAAERAVPWQIQDHKGGRLLSRTCFSARLISVPSAKLCSFSKVLTCSIGSLVWRIPAASDPGDNEGQQQSCEASKAAGNQVSRHSADRCAHPESHLGCDRSNPGPKCCALGTAKGTSGL